jgi:hypothetical protein
MDPVAASEIGKVGQQFGFNALLVVLLLVGFYLLVKAGFSAIAKLHDEHRAERAEMRGEFVSALKENTAAIRSVDDNVRTLKRAQ